MAAGNVTVTVTGNTGPGSSVSSLVIENVTNVNFRFADGVVEVISDRTQRFQYSNLVTVTITPASKTVVLSTS